MDLSKYKPKLIGSADERAVSPVIGVILMVAITVILAAVIATFVMGMGPSDSAPTANYDWDDDGDVISVSHTSGSEISGDDLRLSIESTVTEGDTEISDDFATGDTIYIWVDTDSSDTIEIDTTRPSSDIKDDGADEIDEIQLIWDGDGSSSILTEYP